MEWLNIYGLVFTVVILIPNIVFVIKCRDGFENHWKNKAVEILEQIGRFGCIAFMVIIIPGVGFGFRSDDLFAVYLLADIVLVLAYCVIWVVCFNGGGMFRAVLLSVIPSVIFLLSGILSCYLPLIIAAVLFAPCHILISVKNAQK